ncbi:MAG: hypothetical protein ACLPQS_09840 [Acidimicrobiales bacterium]
MSAPTISTTPATQATPSTTVGELADIRREVLIAGEHTVEVTTRRSPLQKAVLQAFRVDTGDWDQAAIG